VKSSDLVLTPDDQRRLLARVLKSVQRARADMPPVPQSVLPREAVEFLLGHYAISRVEADRAAHALRGSLSDAGPLLAALDQALEERFALARAIRAEREGERAR
jgi:hypothetical protein